MCRQVLEAAVHAYADLGGKAIRLTGNRLFPEALRAPTIEAFAAEHLQLLTIPAGEACFSTCLPLLMPTGSSHEAAADQLTAFPSISVHACMACAQLLHLMMTTTSLANAADRKSALMGTRSRLQDDAHCCSVVQSMPLYGQDCVPLLFCHLP